jgi:altronate hydrolase
MYSRLTEDMDINCGVILDGTATMAQVAQKIFDEMLLVASGKPSKSEELGLGDHEFVPWNIGVVS